MTFTCPERGSAMCGLAIEVPLPSLPPLQPLLLLLALPLGILWKICKSNGVNAC